MLLFDILTFIGAAIGALCLLASFAVNCAPQEAALAATACAFVVIPYCVASIAHRRHNRV